MSAISTTRADDAGAAAAAAAAAASGGEGAGGGGAQAAFYEGFGDEGLKVSAAGWGFKTPEDLAKGYANAEKRFGVDPSQLITLPKDPNDAEAVRAIYGKLGMPEKADGYGFKLADNASDADKAMLGQFADTAHKAGLTMSQAKVLGEWINEQTTAQQRAAAEAFTAQAAEGKAALEKEWGAAAGANFKAIEQAVTKYGDEALVKELGGDKLGQYPNLAKMLGKMLERMAEPASPGPGGGVEQGAAMTPTQAKAALAALEGDPVKGEALMDNAHPQHAAVVAERSRLLHMADGKAPA